MRQERIRKTPRRRPRLLESPALTWPAVRCDTSAAEDLQDRINRVLEVS